MQQNIANEGMRNVVYGTALLCLCILIPHHDGAVAGAHSLGGALHSARAACVVVRAADGLGERAAPIDELRPAGVAERLRGRGTEEWWEKFPWHKCGGHHLLAEAGHELLLLFRCLLEQRIKLKSDKYVQFWASGCEKGFVRYFLQVPLASLAAWQL